MGIDYEAGMIIGANAKKVYDSVSTEDFTEWYEDNGMAVFHLYYDSDYDQAVIGFPVDDILIDDIDQNWVAELKKKGAEFEEIAGIKATLFGCLNVW